MLKTILFAFMVLSLISNAPAQTSTDNIAKAKTFVDLLAKKDFAAAAAFFSDDVKAKLPAEKLGEVWNSLPAQVGNFKGLASIKSEKSNDAEIVVATVGFEKINLDFQMSFDANGKMAGLFFKPSEQSNKNAETYKAPEYVNQALFQEKEVTVGAGTEWALPATLTMPTGKGNFPVVVLVHGSGPNDRDATHLNPVNKPFKDLAWGLASKGIAVLRYEKRTKQHGAKLAAIKDATVKEETVDDALAAVELLGKTVGVDPKRIYILGHSLGGYLIPRIGAADAPIAGLIIFAGLSRPIEEAYLEQHNYFAMLDGSVSKDEQAGLDELKKLTTRIKSLNESDRNSGEFYIGAPVSYYLDLKNYNAPVKAKSLREKILVLQGERDYQVTMTDFQNWKSALGRKKSVTFKSYAKLNHLFMPGEGVPSPADYDKTNHVAPEVISDIAVWILKRK